MAGCDPHCRIGKIKPRGNIVLFPGTTAPELPVNRQPNEPTITLLRDALRKAERGEIIGAATVLVLPEGGTVHNWAGADEHPCSVLLGGLKLLSDDISDRALHPRAAEFIDYDK